MELFKTESGTPATLFHIKCNVTVILCNFCLVCKVLTQAYFQASIFLFFFFTSSMKYKPSSESVYVHTHMQTLILSKHSKVLSLLTKNKFNTNSSH